MMCLRDLSEVEVVVMPQGANIGSIDDAMINLTNATIEGFVIFGKRKLFGLLGREDDLTIKWNEITEIGEDVMIVTTKLPEKYKKNRRFLKFY